MFRQGSTHATHRGAGPVVGRALHIEQVAVIILNGEAAAAPPTPARDKRLPLLLTSGNNFSQRMPRNCEIVQCHGRPSNWTWPCERSTGLWGSTPMRTEN